MLGEAYAVFWGCAKGEGLFRFLKVWSWEIFKARMPGSPCQLPVGPEMDSQAWVGASV